MSLSSQQTKRKHNNMCNPDPQCSFVFSRPSIQPPTFSLLLSCWPVFQKASLRMSLVPNLNSVSFVAWTTQNRYWARVWGWKKNIQTHTHLQSTPTIPECTLSGIPTPWFCWRPLFVVQYLLYVLQCYNTVHGVRQGASDSNTHTYRDISNTKNAYFIVVQGR